MILLPYIVVGACLLVVCNDIDRCDMMPFIQSVSLPGKIDR